METVCFGGSLGCAGVAVLRVCGRVCGVSNHGHVPMCRSASAGGLAMWDVHAESDACSDVLL